MGAAARTCTILIGGQTHTRVQSGTSSCSYVISPATQNFSAAAGSGTVQLSAGATCTWTAASACAYVVVNNGSGTGSATISYTVSANVGAAARTCTILIGGQTHTIVQSGTSSCSYVISPASQNFNSNGGAGTITVQTGSTCTWAASTNCGFVIVSNTSGTGNGVINYTVSQNINANSQSCTIVVGGQTHTIMQEGAANNCNFNISPLSQNFSANGGTGTITMQVEGNCSWMASSSCGFVNVNNSSGTGDGLINYTVSPNTSPNSRLCTIEVAGQKHTQ